MPVAEAVATLRASARPVGGEQQVSLVRALGRVLACDIDAPLDVPPAANSAMDGYAIRHADWRDDGTMLPVSQRIPAGTSPAPLAPGTVARIFTGAEIPDGADTVVMQEDCDAEGVSVRIRACPPVGDNIRPRGQDIARGDRILRAGHRLLPQDLGLLASLGLESAPVRPRLKVAVISNGDELIEPGQALAPGQIYNSNRYLLHGLLGQWGFEVVDLGIVPDRPDVLRDALEQAAGSADVVISSGGVSVGEEDHVRTVVASIGRLDLWKIAIKPGKPLAFGAIGDTPFIGLPGNPVSTLVTCLVIARPFLFACQGRHDAPLLPALTPARFAHPGSGREEWLRVRRDRGGVQLYANQSSGVLLSASWGDGLVRQAPGEDIEPGGLVEFLGWAQFH